MARSSPPNVEHAKRVYSDLVRAVLDLAAECPESRHVVALSTVVEAFHDHVLWPLESGGRPKPSKPVRDEADGERKLLH